MTSPVQLYIRVRIPDGSYPYLKPAYASNGRIRPHYAIHNGRATHFAGSNYYLRYCLNGKRVWDSAGSDPSLALITLQQKVLALQEVAPGRTEAAPATTTVLPPYTIPKVNPSKRLLASCVRE